MTTSGCSSLTSSHALRTPSRLNPQRSATLCESGHRKAGQTARPPLEAELDPLQPRNFGISAGVGNGGRITDPKRTQSGLNSGEGGPGGTRSPIGQVTRTQGTSAREFEARPETFANASKRTGRYPGAGCPQTAARHPVARAETGVAVSATRPECGYRLRMRSIRSLTWTGVCGWRASCSIRLRRMATVSTLIWVSPCCSRDLAQR